MELLCKRMSDVAWPRDGRQYDNWKQLLGTMSDILGRPEKDFDALRTSDYAIEDQHVTTQQLKLFGFPNLDMTSKHSSYQNIDASVEEI